MGGQRELFDDRYFFITNIVTVSREEIVFEANSRCNQENLIGQLKGGVHATNMPLGCMVSNGAYMVMAALDGAESLVGVVGTGRLCAGRRSTRERRTHAATHGVRHIPPRGHARSMPDREDRETFSVPPPRGESRGTLCSSVYSTESCHCNVDATHVKPGSGCSGISLTPHPRNHRL